MGVALWVSRIYLLWHCSWHLYQTWALCEQGLKIKRSAFDAFEDAGRPNNSRRKRIMQFLGLAPPDGSPYADSICLDGAPALAAALQQ